MARMRRDRDVRGVIYEPFWNWILAGRPVTQESERGHFSGMEWWLFWYATAHWRPCSSCGEGLPERAIRLLSAALELGTVGLSDDERVMLDDANVQQIIATVDEIESPPAWEWWRDHDCTARKGLRLEEAR